MLIILSTALHLFIDAFTGSGTPPAAVRKHPPCRPWRTWLIQQVEENTGLPISARQFATLDRSLWRSLRVRPSASQAQL